MAVKRNRTRQPPTEQSTDREPTANAPEAPALAETNQSANGAEAKTDDTQALDLDKTPPIGGLAPDAEKAAAGDANPQAGDASSEEEENGLVYMRLDDSLLEDYTGPTNADVHPDEVNNMLAGGWVIDPVVDDPDA